jgi:phospholipase/lecithinase/hemolysin
MARLARRLWFVLLAIPIAACSSGGDDSAPPPGVTTPPSSSGSEVSALFVLGDSLSDVGNAAAAADALLGRPVLPPTVGLCNPTDVLALARACDDLFYGKSRVSNGPVAVEVLATRLGLPSLQPSFHLLPNRPAIGTDYAVASAKARESSAKDLTQQVERLVLDHNPLSATALYVVMIGGNDAIDAVQTAGDAAVPSAASLAVVDSAVAAIGAAVERLVAFGARRIVVANLPDLATLPALNDGAARLAVASAITAAFDVALETRLVAIETDTRAKLANPPTLLRFDLRAALHAAQDAIAAAGGDAVDACFDSDRYRQTSTAERVFAPGCAASAGESPRFDRFVFWAGLHPTGATHALLGAALFELL